MFPKAQHLEAKLQQDSTESSSGAWPLEELTQLGDCGQLILYLAVNFKLL